jgi:threonylcarbamoyladenosine tRNA methylthiotransferase MtaB
LFTVALSTLGCKVNQYESAGILEELDKASFSVVPFHTKADCYIINTCSVTKKTDFQSRQLIRRAIKNNPEALIIVTGCYAQTSPEDIAGIPGVSLIMGNLEKKNIPSLINEMKRNAPQILVSDIHRTAEFTGFFPERFPGHTRAFLKIQDGCNHYCTYCIVPFARGPSRSLPEQEVLNRIAILAKNHYREIVLTGIHLGMYGHDLLPPSQILNIMKQV